jgi:phosphoglycerate dehydrogenase-like enzyme
MTEQRTQPAETKLTLCVIHPFSEWRATPNIAEAISRHWPEMRVAHLHDFKELPAELPDTDIFVGSSLRVEQFAYAKRLKWIHSTSAGVSQLSYPELQNSEVVVTNPRGIFSIPMAEHTIGLLLALARNFPDSVHYQDRSQWGQQEIWDRPQHLTELNGQLLLILGFGSIGRELARRAKALDMRIWGVTRSGKGDASLAEKIVPIAELQKVLPDADYVVIAAPETKETNQLIGVAELALMKKSARIINVARGSLLDQAALVEALKHGRLAGAALDVTEPEPPLAEDPLWHAPNLFITPHTSAISDRLWTRQTHVLLDNLQRWFSGHELINRVDLKLGY